ncbi:MarR family winged helix-turn-helix transcriptional regulator [Dyella psychrodurans]|uniref:MarR family transcriptional regulator n=1 Tax=Dyella psychrodurans TaxID=1927960 RepID=A0A370XD63_9GAMM|nr:MarR family winged helix-turn-helix transcriptional regulator [Dyella psychrodurans]RDS86242.1 MarR family transcriptional regulator [Dyella psychrodurans]
MDTSVTRKHLTEALASASRRGATAKQAGARRSATRDHHEHVAHALVRTSSAFKRLTTQRMKEEFAITGIQAEILMLLATAPAMLGNDLAAVVGVNASTVSHALDGMEKSGLLTRMRCTEDRRVVRIALTERAKRMARRTIDITRHILDAITRGISQSDLKALQRGLKQMADNCQTHAHSPKQRRDARIKRTP